jgi:hypothetical protein
VPVRNPLSLNLAVRHDVPMVWARRRRQESAPRPAAEPASPVSALADYGREALVRGGEALDRLIDQLHTVDESGDLIRAREALRVLQLTPRVVVRLDVHARQISWRLPYYSPVINEAADRLRSSTAGPIAVALASAHGDGHVRERAVRRMLTVPGPQWMPFLVLRTADWVKPVRDRARAGLALLLAEDVETYLPAVLGTMLVVRDRRHGGFAHTQVLAALMSAPVRLRDRLLATGDRAQRRLLFGAGLSHGWWPQETLFALAVADPDVRIRARAAEAVCRQAVWSRQIDTLRRLAHHPRTEVRVVALTGLARAGHDAEVSAHLDDPASLVRAIARDAARRTSIDVLGHYRSAVGLAAPAPGAVAGLAESGSQADALLLRELLTHPARRVRALAVRALRQLRAVPVEQTIRMLRDPSPAVVREATAALWPLTRAVPAEVGWDLLADQQRVELRRAGYRLLRARGLAEQLRAALLLAGDADPRLTSRALADATRLARDAAGPGRRHRLPALEATPVQIAELAELTDQVAGVLGADTTRMLHTWLAASTSGS